MPGGIADMRTNGRLTRIVAVGALLLAVGNSLCGAWVYYHLESLRGEADAVHVALEKRIEALEQRDAAPR